MTKIQAIREFATFVLSEFVTIAQDRCEEGNWRMDTHNKSPRLILPMELDYPLDESDKAFRKNFIKLCPIAVEFSDVTLTILHECGHWATRSVYDAVEYSKYRARTDEATYFTNPWEILATQWAICWLLSPIDQKMAHRFEERYYGRD